jgi:hypothetical protein
VGLVPVRGAGEEIRFDRRAKVGRFEENQGMYDYALAGRCRGRKNPSGLLWLD